MIHFEATDVILPVSIDKNTKKWVLNVIQAHQKKAGEVFFLFCSDEALLRINQQFLQHDFYTDIITFDNSESEEVISGELYISLDRVIDNAATLNTDFETELHRVIIHGVLHLIGFNDKTADEQSTMRAAEQKCLSLRH
ncbi:MAG: rRNA maturation RNase YbeY [Bacteroidales bacterium]|jgi:rRNA maturation RNase YbeY|nr:rRNA maturation RNase YbeY [Bacteroidales bacterium]